MQIRTILADDETAARSRLRRLLSQYPQIQIIGEAANGLEAVEAIERLRPGLLFLDVQMPGLNGFEVLKGLSSGSMNTRWRHFERARSPICSNR
jgi:two-component system LytT family response regulator